MEDLTAEETEEKMREMGEGVVPRLPRTLLASETRMAGQDLGRETVAAQLGLV